MPDGFIDEAGEPRSCGTRLIMRFIENPTAPLDTGCVAQVRSIDFTLPRTEVTTSLFGGPDAWE